MGTGSSISTKMELNVPQQESVRSATVQNASLKMEYSLNEIQLSCEVFKPKLEVLKCCITNQKSLDDVCNTMHKFRAYFHDVKAYYETMQDSFERQMGIILGDDYDKQLLCIENNLGATSPEQPFSESRTNQDPVHSYHKTSVSSDLQKNDLSPVPGSSTCTYVLDVETAQCKPQETTSSIQCNSSESGNHFPSDPKENVAQNFSNSYESYDSSNDLPEARANILAVSKQMPDSSINISETSSFPNNSDPPALSKHDNVCLSNVDSVVVSSTRPDSLSGLNCSVNTCSNIKSDEKQTGSTFDSQVSESLLRNVSPALFERSQDNDFNENTSDNELPTNSKEEEKNTQSEINTELNLKVSERTPYDSDSSAPLIVVKIRKKINGMGVTSKKVNEMDATSKKVNDWLNRSLPSDSLSVDKISDGKAYSNSNVGSDEDDAKTEISDFDPASRDGTKKTTADNASEVNSDKGSVISLNENTDNGSASTEILLKEQPDMPCEDVSKLQSEDEENYPTIELSDDDAATSASNIKTSSPVSKFIKRCEENLDVTLTPIKAKRAENDDCIDLVESEETADNDDVCVIESSQELKKSETKSLARLAHIISESSESDTGAEVLIDKVNSGSESNGSIAVTVDNTESDSNAATQEVKSLLQDDEAKRKLLASSSSSYADSVGTSGESDSDVTVKIKKSKKYKKKRRKDSDRSVNKSEENSDEKKINRLLNLDNLGKRKRVSESSGSSTDSKSFVSLSDKIGRKKKKKEIPEIDENETSFLSDADSTKNSQILECELDHLNFSESSQNIEAIKNDDTDFYRKMLLASDSSCDDAECPLSPVISEHTKNKRKKCVSKTNPEEGDQCMSPEENDSKKKKKQKYDPLLQGKFSLSGSESEKENVSLSRDRQMNDEKYKRLLEKKKRKEESRCVAKGDMINSSDGENSLISNGEAADEKEDDQKEPINFVSCEPECVEISEDDSEDDRTTIEYHQLSSSDDDEISTEVPQSQETVSSNMSGRKNIKKIKSSKDLTEESKQAAKEEEERRKRISDKEKLLSQTFSAPEVKKLILDFDKDSKQELVTVHPVLMEILKEHQIEGIKFMWNTCFETVNQTKKTGGSGCVLAHCMGLGKSLQIVALVHTIINHPELNLKTVLIVCPKSVILNWGDEFKKWLKRVEEMDINNRKVNIFDLTDLGSTIMKERGLSDWQSNGGVMIMSYAGFRGLVKDRPYVPQNVQIHLESIKRHLLDPGPDIIVCDEGHTLKNDSTEIHRTINLVRTKRRIVLTGTPMQNNLMEYYYMVSLVKPSYLGDKKEFRNRFFNPIDNGQYMDSTLHDVKIMKSRAHILHKKLDGLVQRYDANIFENLLPKRYEYVLKLRMTEPQISLYKTYIDGLKKEVNVENSRLMQSDVVLGYIQNHPRLLSYIAESSVTGEQGSVKGDWEKCLENINLDDVELSAKTVLFFEILQKCGELGDKLLVFSQQLKNLDLLEFFLKKRSHSSSDLFHVSNSESKEMWISGKDYFRLDGKTSTVDRQNYCRIFNNPNNKRARLFLLSSKAGGLGMNLTGANRAIVFDVNWNPSIDAQSVFRIYRFGQQKVCYIYKFVTKGTMEEKKYHRQVAKLSTSSRVVDKRQVNRHYQERYLRALFEYNFNYDEVRSTPKVPADNVLAELLLKSNCIETYEEQDVLLKNNLDEELSEEDRRKAWEDYEKERNAPTPSASNANSFPSAAYNEIPNSNGMGAGMSHCQTNFSVHQGRTNPQGCNLEYSPSQLNILKHQERMMRLKQEANLKNLLNRNIIPLPYQPLKLPPPVASSEPVVGLPPEGNTSSSGTTSKNSENVNHSTVNEANNGENANQKPQNIVIVKLKPNNNSVPTVGTAREASTSSAKPSSSNTNPALINPLSTSTQSLSSNTNQTFQFKGKPSKPLTKSSSLSTNPILSIPSNTSTYSSSSNTNQTQSSNTNPVLTNTSSASTHSLSSNANQTVHLKGELLKTTTQSSNINPVLRIPSSTSTHYLSSNINQTVHLKGKPSKPSTQSSSVSTNPVLRNPSNTSTYSSSSNTNQTVHLKGEPLKTTTQSSSSNINPVLRNPSSTSSHSLSSNTNQTVHLKGKPSKPLTQSSPVSSNPILRNPSNTSTYSSSSNTNQTVHLKGEPLRTTTQSSSSNINPILRNPSSISTHSLSSNTDQTVHRIGKPSKPSTQSSSLSINPVLSNSSNTSTNSSSPNTNQTVHFKGESSKTTTQFSSLKNNPVLRHPSNTSTHSLSSNTNHTVHLKGKSSKSSTQSSSFNNNFVSINPSSPSTHSLSSNTNKTVHLAGEPLKTTTQSSSFNKNQTVHRPRFTTSAESSSINSGLTIHSVGSSATNLTKSSLNNIIEDLKNFVKAKKNGDPAS